MSSLGYTPRARQGDVKRTGRQWRSGPPPHAGWWNASAFQDRRVWRWWDGSRWSWSARDTASASSAGRVAMQSEPAARQRCILWTDYWPEGARVARVKP